MLGVSGIRGIVGETMTPQLALDASCALAAYLKKPGPVVVGRDSRPSGRMIAAAVTAGLTASGRDVLDIGVVSTPAIGLRVRELKAAGGIMITASHNPGVWNGIKYITPAGHAPAAEEATAILDVLKQKAFRFVDFSSLGHVTRDDATNEHHVATVLKAVNGDAIHAKRFRVVLDSVNGAGGASGRALLEALGCTVVHLNGDATGDFAHGPEPIAENLTGLADATRREKAQVGFAQDPDADRLAIVDETGRYIGEEYTLAIAARATIEREPSGGCIVANLSTSRMVDDLAARAGGGWRVHRTAVGEANVVAGMMAERAVIGGEGNGGVIDPRVGWIRDSLVAMALTLEVMARAGRPLSEVVDSLPRYEMVKTKQPCERSVVTAALNHLRTAFTDASINTVDGVRLDWPEGWVHVRASNTEPIMRVIAEAGDGKSADKLIERVNGVITGL